MEFGGQMRVPKALLARPPRKQTRWMPGHAEKLRIVEESYAEGVPVATVACSHEANANLIFNWRRLYRPA